jgi:hypothetical protein
VKVCEIPPPRCASCYGQYTDRKHVDLEASYDGPVVEGGIIGEDGERQDTIKVSIDELVLCELCLREAAGLIGMVDGDDSDDELRQRVQDLAERNAGLQAYVDQLEKTIAAKPEPPAKKKQQRRGARA